MKKAELLQAGIVLLADTWFPLSLFHALQFLDSLNLHCAVRASLYLCQPQCICFYSKHLPRCRVIPKGSHLVRLWEHPHLGDKLVADMKMPRILVQALRSWGGTQDVVTNLAGGEVTFKPRVAMRVSVLACRAGGCARFVALVWWPWFGGQTASKYIWLPLSRLSPLACHSQL